MSFWTAAACWDAHLWARLEALGFPVDDVRPWLDGLDLSLEALCGGHAR